MYLSPFLSLRGLVTSFGFDARLFLSNVVYPLWAFPVHAWVFASLFGQAKYRSAIRATLLAFFVGCFLVGVFSLQSRHKVLIQPLFYVLAACGLQFGSQTSRNTGYGLSALWLIVQIAYVSAM